MLIVPELRNMFIMPDGCTSLNWLMPKRQWYSKLTVTDLKSKSMQSSDMGWNVYGQAKIQQTIQRRAVSYHIVWNESIRVPKRS